MLVRDKPMIGTSDARAVGSIPRNLFLESEAWKVFLGHTLAILGQKG